VKRLIASYKALRSVELVEALPVSSAGKVLERELRERYSAFERAVSASAA
jgi:acyl-CoA synthetase (AMP-forming)/AMP-acid ligase II